MLSGLLKPHHSNKFSMTSDLCWNLWTLAPPYAFLNRDFYPRFHVSRQASHNSEGAFDVRAEFGKKRLHGGGPDMSFSVLEVVCQSLYLLQCNGVQSDSKCTFCDIVGHVMSWDRAALWKFAGHNDRKSEIHQEVRTQAGRDILVLEGWRIADDWALATHMISIDFSRNLKRHHLAISILKPYSYHIVFIISLKLWLSQDSWDRSQWLSSGTLQVVRKIA